jgi:hypothetical protein
MSDYKKIVEDALRKSREVNGKISLTKTIKNKYSLNESLVYPEGIIERMHPKLEDELGNNNHSLKGSPIFPEGDEHSFEQKIMGDRFHEVVNHYKRAYDVRSINNKNVMNNMIPLVKETMKLERNHIKELEELAIKMVREEFDMDEDSVEIHAELVPQVSLIGTKKNPTPMSVDLEFKNHDEMVNAKDEVYKRRFVNAMIQGASMKCNHMFHMVDDELNNLDPRLGNKYSKLVSSAEYLYYVVPKLEDSITGGIVKVEFPTKDNPKSIIYAQAMVFPVLINELVKGVMEIMSAHGLPKNKKIGNYVIDKADYLEAEPWDIRLGPALWGRFTAMIDPDDFELKHHIYTDLVSLPVKEFNVKMREIMAGTKEGKKIIKDVVSEIRNDFKSDDFNDAMTEVSQSSGLESNGYNFDELMGGDDSSDEDESPGWSFDELY